MDDRGGERSFRDLHVAQLAVLGIEQQYAEDFLAKRRQSLIRRSMVVRAGHRGWRATLCGAHARVKRKPGSPGCSVVGFLLRIFAVCQKMRSFVHHSVAESCIHSPTSDNMDRLTMSRTSVVLVSLLIAASIVAAQTPPARESSARSEAIRRYQNLLNNNSPAISTSRDEILFRLGLLYLEDAQAAGPGVGSYGNRDRYEQAL